MQAIQQRVYGDVSDLVDVTLPKPTPKPTQILIQVKAISLNGSDTETIQGKPFYTRIIGLRRPRKTVLGSDITGVVEAVGSDVTHINVGDAVMGDLVLRNGGNGFAPYIAADADAFAHKPEYLSFIEAAAIPQAGAIAVQAMRDALKLQPGETILINGAGGSAGTFAIQLAKLMGATVTGVDSAAKQQLMRDLGAEYVLDYRETDFTKTGERYDAILDLVSSRGPRALRRALTEKGRYVTVGGQTRRILQFALFGKLGGQPLSVLALQVAPKDLDYLNSLIEKGDVTVALDRVYPRSQLREALEYQLGWNHQGRVVVEF